MGQSTWPYIGVGSELEFCRMAYIVLEPDAAISFRRAEVEARRIVDNRSDVRV